MRLTTKGRFAVTAMLDLALNATDGPVTLAGISASSYRYVSQRGVADHPVRQRLRALAELRPRWGSPRLHWLLVREGLVVNHKRTERLYGEERFAVTRRRRRKRVSAPRVVPAGPGAPDRAVVDGLCARYPGRWAALSRVFPRR